MTIDFLLPGPIIQRPPTNAKAELKSDAPQFFVKTKNDGI